MVILDCSPEGQASLEDLQSQFLQFQKATNELQDAYRSLKDRAASVDRELAESNRALRDRLDERERILQSMPLGVFHQRNGAVKAGNEEGQRLLRDLGRGILNKLQGLPPEGEVKRLEIVSLDSSLRILEVTSLGLGGDSSEVLHFVVDQTEVLSLQKEVSRLDRIEGLATLSLGVAHEIRNPLNGLGGFASLVRRNPTSSKVGEWAEQIEVGVRRVERIVRDLLAFARPEKRGNPKTQNLRDWLNQVEEDIPTSVSCEDAEILLKGDEIAFPAVLKNLVRNAKEAGASLVRFQVKSSDAKYCYLHVEDDGVGLPLGWKERVFDPFVSGKETGTGLGLAFCRKALESMGGGIQALNDGVKGAKFELRVSVGRR
jgi:signal transduction histidine kinase